MEELSVKALDKVVKQTVAAIEDGKTQIYDIYEAARVEMENVKKDAERVKNETAEIIFKVDELARKERRARLRLVEVHRDYNVYSEEDMQAAYTEAENAHVELEVAREHERNLRQQRDNLELRLRTLQTTVDKAETLVSQVGVVLGFLGNEMGSVLSHIGSMQQRQIFGAKIIKAQEEERLRVSREIHDGPAQAMANVVFRAEVCERLIDTDIERAKAELKDLREQVRAALQETRKIIFDLRPMTIDDLGLVPTLRRVLDNLRERTGITAEIRVMGQERRIESYLEVGLFRIIQETLNNVEKHAKAQVVLVKLDFDQRFVAAVVADNGLGFDPEVMVGNEHFGLMGIKERMRILGGEIQIKSAKGQGTKVYLKVPLK
jgi:two-component system sensor histidine kinase DegS